MKLPGDIDLRLSLAVWMRNVTVYRQTWMTNLLPNFFEPLWDDAVFCWIVEKIRGKG